MSDTVSRQPVFNVPDEVARIAGEMSGFSAPWALGGGWAVDFWIGETTREHGDVDVIVFANDHRALYDYLNGWQLAHHPNQPDDGNALWDGRRLQSPDHLHGRLHCGEDVPERGALWPEQGWHLDVQFNERDGDSWILSREPSVTVPIERGFLANASGLPVVAPEVTLFYKALDLRRRDRLDFGRLAPLLSDAQRAWLRDAIATVGHPWLPELSR